MSGVILGRKAELMSPIPTKKSSTRTTKRQIYAHMLVGNKECRPTWYDLDEIGRPLPDIGSVVNYHHHGCIARKKSLQALLCQTWVCNMNTSHLEPRVGGNLLPLSSRDRILPPKKVPPGSMAAQTSSAYALVPMV